MTTTENKILLELELILSFLGIKFIDYKGKRTSNGHVSVKTIGDIKNFFGKKVMTSGQHIEDITWWDFKNDWNDLMFLVEKIESLGFEFFIVENRCEIRHNTDKSIDLVMGFELTNKKIDVVYYNCIEFVKWYNENNPIN